MLLIVTPPEDRTLVGGVTEEAFEGITGGAKFLLESGNLV